MIIEFQALLCLLFFSLVVDVRHSSGAGPPPKPNPLLLTCGSSAVGTDADGRKWEPDSRFLKSTDKSVMATAQSQDSSLPSPVPFMTARIFTAEATYNFPIGGPGRYFLRLYFYPAPYPNFNLSNSYFSAVAGGVTVLNNFSASITAEALSQAYLVKEFSLVSSDSDTVSITFKPSDKYKDSFAFVNGIELVPSPEFFDDSVPLAGTPDGDGTTIPASGVNMQLMYRLNIGGQYIPPPSDSAGLMRSWYDDTPYLYGASIGVTDQANTTIGYDGLPSYSAPIDVYSTLRSMGPDPNINKGYNLTWTFPIDVNFTYLVRFHFCDFQLDKINQRVFSIYLNNQTGIDTADVIAWAGQKGAPVVKDFAVRVNDQPGDDDLLWVALHPNDDVKPQFLDAVLNGLEVFKLDARNNLSAPNPTISDLMLKQQQLSEGAAQFAPQKSRKRQKELIIGGAAGGAAGFCVIAVVFVVAYKRKRRYSGSDTGSSSWLPIYGNSHTSCTKSTISGKSHGSTTISSDAACNCRYFSLSEIKHGTKNFDESHVIGVGGFGKVYRGVIDGDKKVAIKRSNPSSEQGVNEFQTEIEMLSKLRHRHLVSLIGFCEENNEMILVYDYMGHGTLREHLYKGNKITMPWKQRLEICIGSARGLHYLHTGAKYTIIHRDVKTTNILLDEKWVAKVSDFGLSKTGPNMNQGHVSTVVKGSFGYLDPEYFRRQQLTEKSDVYSFGVVLFEVLCARPALNPSLPKEQVSLADWALHCQRKGVLEEHIDPQLKGKITPECFKKFAETAEKCLADHGIDRPSMGDVLWNLEYALQLQDNPEGANQPAAGDMSGGVDCDGVGEPVMDNHSLLAMHRSTLSLGSDVDTTDHENSTTDIFSQIVNPKGR